MDPTTKLQFVYPASKPNNNSFLKYKLYSPNAAIGKNSHDFGAQSKENMSSVIKAKDLNFESPEMLLKFFIDYRESPTNILEQILSQKWTDTKISHFCFNCQFVQYDIDDEEIKLWYRKLSLFLQKQVIRLTKFDLKKQDIKNLQHIYSESKAYMEKISERSQKFEEHAKNVMLMTKYLVLNRNHEKLTIIAIILGFICMFLLISFLQIAPIITEVLLQSTNLKNEQKKVLIQISSFWFLFGLSVNSLIGAITVFFAIKKLYPYFLYVFRKLTHFDGQSQETPQGQKPTLNPQPYRP